MTNKTSVRLGNTQMRKPNTGQYKNNVFNQLNLSAQQTEALYIYLSLSLHPRRFRRHSWVLPSLTLNEQAWANPNRAAILEFILK